MEPVNTSSNEIHFRPSSGGPRVVTYGAETRVVFRGHGYPVTQLETDGVVAVQLGKDAHGNPYAIDPRPGKHPRFWIRP